MNNNSSSPKSMHGLLALSPLFVFLTVYLVSSIIANDFYKIPISSAFLISSIYAVCITRGRKIEERVRTFSNGASNSNILMMIWIFILAGVFAGTANKIGSIDATVDLALTILPENLLYAGLFLASCFISLSIGTSVGTIVALVPIAAGIADELALGGATGVFCSTPFICAIIVGGAFFGDNLSFISDTTIAATRTQGVSMRDKFRANLRIVAPAAVLVTVLYIFLGSEVSNLYQAESINFIKLVPYLLVIILALYGMNVTVVLTIGIAMNAVIGLCDGSLGWTSFLESAGAGIDSMGELIIVTMLAGGMLEIIKANGGLDYIVNSLTRRISNKRGAELCIAGVVSLANICTANNTIAIITSGRIASDITKRYNLDPRRTASILDTFSCLVQGIIPYGAQLLMAAGLAGISSVSMLAYLYYPAVMGICALLTILLRKQDNCADPVR